MHWCRCRTHFHLPLLRTESLWHSEFRANLSGRTVLGKHIDLPNEVPKSKHQNEGGFPTRSRAHVRSQVIHEGAEAGWGTAIHYQPDGSLGKQVPLDPTASCLPTQPDLPDAQQRIPKRGSRADSIPPLPCESKGSGGPSSPRGNPSSIHTPAVPNRPALARKPGPALVITMVG